MLNEHFEKLGFNNKEHTIFMALAELGRTTASVLSKETEIPRATVYFVLDSLKEKGLISQEQTSSGTVFTPNHPTAFSRLIEQRKQEIREQESVAKELENLLAPYIATSQLDAPKFIVLEGKKNIENLLYENLDEWRNSLLQTTDKTLWGFQDHEIVTEFPRWHDHLWRTRPAEEKIWLFSNSENIKSERKIKVPERQVKELPIQIDFKSCTWLYGDYIIIISIWKKPNYVVQIKDTVIAANLRTIFKLLWHADFSAHPDVKKN